MEIKINKEIRQYQESIFFGLSMRQFFCAVLAIAVAVIVYFSTRNVLHKEIVSWLCILSAMPIGMMGFVKYHGLTFERFIMAWIRSEVLYPKQLVFKENNIYAQAMQSYLTQKKRSKSIDKNTKED
ncbi:MAG: PrgI family protein [Clostridia bacterium]|nr:PrgI family protein [Clostridia bacterium]